MTRQATATVAICTRGSSPTLRNSLRSAIDAAAEAGAGEVLVVDNNPTPQVTIPPAPVPVRVVHEARTGISHARNCALAEADSELVAFVDDDVTVRPGWLAAHFDAHTIPGTVAVGGPVHLAWPTEPPHWYTAAFAPFFSGIDHGGASRTVDRSELPIGANFSVQRAAARQVGGFGPELGRRGANLRSGEDTDLARRLLTSYPDGVRWAPDAVVDHHVRPERCRSGWIIRRAWAAGTSEAIHHRNEGRPNATTPRQIFTRRYSHPNDTFATRAVDLVVRAALAGGYWAGHGQPGGRKPA